MFLPPALACKVSEKWSETREWPRNFSERLKRAEKVDENFSLRLIALKTRLNYYVKQGQFEDTKSLQDTFISLNNTVLEIENNYINLPSHVIDTLIWCKWILFPNEFAESSQREAAIKNLGDARDKERNPKKRSEINLHIKMIREGDSPLPTNSSRA